MTTPRTTSPIVRQQRGVALFVGLMLLLVLTLLGLSSSNVSIMQERMASNVREYNVAFQRAEDALREAEQRVRYRTNMDPASTWQDYGMEDMPEDCTLDRKNAGDWDNAGWTDLADDSQSILIVELNQFDDADGNPFVPCRPSTGVRRDGTPITGEYYVVAARGRGPGGEDRQAEVIVQSIFFWPN